MSTPVSVEDHVIAARRLLSEAADLLRAVEWLEPSGRQEVAIADGLRMIADTRERLAPAAAGR